MLVIAEWVTNVHTFVSIYSFVDSGTNSHCCKLWGMSENLICKHVFTDDQHSHYISQVLLANTNNLHSVE